jgi:hypothetical protein
MARNIRPAGAIRAGALGFDSVMAPAVRVGFELGLRLAAL